MGSAAPDAPSFLALSPSSEFPDENEFIAFGSLRVDGGSPQPKVQLEHGDLHPGPHATTLAGGVRQVVYSVSVQFTMTGGGSARIQGQVVTEDGSVFDVPFCQEFTGTHGQTFGCSIGASL